MSDLIDISISDCFRAGGSYLTRRGEITQRPSEAIDEPRVAVYSLVRTQGKILLAWPNIAEGYADLPGGGIEPGEKISVAIAREWEEETGKKFPFMIGTEPARAHYQKINFHAEDAGRYFGQYQQTFYAYHGTGSMPVEDIERRFWKTNEGLVSWELIANLPNVPINRVHWLAINALLKDELGGSVHSFTPAPPPRDLNNFVVG